jgi:Domain of unknown function (DUF4386)
MTVQRYARIAGVLCLLSFVAGGFGEAYVPSKLMVSGDATATANNIHALGSLFRWGFAGYLVEASCDIALTLILYVLLKPVSRGLALLAAFFGWVLRGYLIFRSGYLPRFLGVLMTLGGLAFITRNFRLVLTPAYAPGSLLLLMVPGGLALAVWLLVRGVNGQRSKEQANAAVE